MKYDTIIKNGTIVTSDKTCKSDIGIADEKISAIEKNLSPKNSSSVIDATGKIYHTRWN